MYNYFVLHFFICQLIATCLACLCPFISFLIINLTFSKFVLMPTGIFLPSTCSDSTAKLCCVEEKMIHLAVNVEDSILSMHGHCKKGSPDRHEWTGRQSDRHTHRQRVWQTYKQRQTDRKMEGRQGRQAVGERKSRVLQKLQWPTKTAVYSAWAHQLFRENKHTFFGVGLARKIVVTGYLKISFN